MKKRILLIFSFCMMTFLLFANMSSPIIEGSTSGLPFVNQHVKIIGETIKIRPDAGFERCAFDIQYLLESDSDGIAIPLLFVAENYLEGMQIQVDGSPVKLVQVSDDGLNLENSPFADFAEIFEMDDNGYAIVVVSWDAESSREYRLRDLHYFETNLSAGKHEIRIQYAAEVWKNKRDWVIGKYFSYLLSPAKNWKSFGKLHVALDKSECKIPMITNLGESKKDANARLEVWDFDQIPLDEIRITANPEVTANAQRMIGLGREGFMWIAGILMFLLHILLMWMYRKKKPNRKFSWIWLVGSIIIPFASLLVYVMAESWIYSALGDAASHRGSYSILIIFLYPLVLIVYALITWLIDFAFRKMYKVE